MYIVICTIVLLNINDFILKFFVSSLVYIISDYSENCNKNIQSEYTYDFTIEIFKIRELF